MSNQPDPSRRARDALKTLVAEVRGCAARTSVVLDLSERDAMLALADRAEFMRRALDDLVIQVERATRRHGTAMVNPEMALAALSEAAGE